MIALPATGAAMLALALVTAPPAAQPHTARVTTGAAAAANPSPAPAATPVPMLAPEAVIARYQHALATLAEPRVFAVEYTVQQTGTRSLDQTHRIFRSGRDERDETLAVNGARSKYPVVRIFRGRPYRYTVAALSPKPGAYAFAFAGPHRNGKHVDYVFGLAPAGAPPKLAFTRVTIDGITFLPQSVEFASAQHRGHGSVTFAKSGKYWVARSATAQAGTSAAVTREQIAFSGWRFPTALPGSTFSTPRPLATVRPALP